jgi:hypothetical protein
MFKIAVIYSKWPNNIPTFSIPKALKIYPKLGFLV